MTGITLPEPINPINATPKDKPTHPAKRVYNKVTKLGARTLSRPEHSTTNNTGRDSATNLRQYSDAPQTKHLTGNAFRSATSFRNAGGTKKPPIDVAGARIINKTFGAATDTRAVHDAMKHTMLNSTTTSDFSKRFAVENAFDYDFDKNGDVDLFENTKYDNWRGTGNHSYASSRDLNHTVDRTTEYKNNVLDKTLDRTSNTNTGVYCRLSRDELCSGLASLGLGLTKIVSISGKGFLHLCTSISEKTETLLNDNKISSKRKCRNRFIQSVPECSCEQCSIARRLTDSQSGYQPYRWHEGENGFDNPCPAGRGPEQQRSRDPQTHSAPNTNRMYDYRNQNDKCKPHQSWIDSYRLTLGESHIKKHNPTDKTSYANREGRGIIIEYDSDLDEPPNASPQINWLADHKYDFSNPIISSIDITIDDDSDNTTRPQVEYNAVEIKANAEQHVRKFIPQIQPHATSDSRPLQQNTSTKVANIVSNVKSTSREAIVEPKINNSFDRYKPSELVERGRKNPSVPPRSGPGITAHGSSESQGERGEIAIKGNVQANRTVQRVNAESALYTIAEESRNESPVSEETKDGPKIERNAPRDVMGIKGDLNGLVQGNEGGVYGKGVEIDIKEDDKTVVEEEEEVCSEESDTKSEEDAKRKTKNYLFSIYKWSKTKKDKNAENAKKS